jgi:hypothetical protein
MAYTTIDDPEAYFQVKLYTGDGSTPSITLDGDTDMQPDLVWIKNRDQTDSNCLFDAVRGATKVIHADATDTETTDADTLTSFDSDGFALGADVKVNTDTEAYVAWCWKAGTSFSNDASATSIGTVDSTGSASATAGFSIVSFDLTGESGNETIKHGLSTAPKVVITKRRSGGAGDWTSYFGAIGNTYLVLQRTLAGQTTTDFMNNTAPTTSVFTVGDPSWWATDPFIAYCFSEVQGFSKFGSYTGNGNADGAFIYTGFRPAYLLLKDYTSANNYNWVILDNKRDPSNGIDRRLQASGNVAEYTDVSNLCDFVSNGFKWTTSNANWNASGTGYIYMAFAEAPFVNSNGVPCNAR